MLQVHILVIPYNSMPYMVPCFFTITREEIRKKLVEISIEVCLQL